MSDKITKKDLLKRIVDEGMIMKNPFIILTKNTHDLNRLLKRTVKSKLLSERKFKTEAGYNIKYYAITPSGLEWIKNNCSEDLPWVKELMTPIPKFYLTQIRNHDSLYKFLKSITVSVILKQFDVKTIQSYITKQIKECTSIPYKKLIYNAKRISQDKIINGKTSPEKKIYIHSKDFRDYFTISKEEAHQYAFSNHTGVLLFRLTSYLIYTSTPDGIRILSKGTERYQRAVAEQFSKINAQNYTEKQSKNGIIFCKNAREWVKTFNQNIFIDTNRKKQINIRGLFDNLYCLPITKDMMSILENILEYNGDYRERIIEYLLSSDKDFKYTNQFFYKGCEASMGLDMNLSWLQRIYNQASLEENRNKTFYIVCNTWQREFYEKVMPENIKYYIYENNI